MSKKGIFKLGLFVLISFFLGCAGEAPTSVETNKLMTEFSVTRSSNKVTCRAQFWEGSKAGANLKLTGGDQVWCQGNMMIEKSNFKGQTWYETDVTFVENSEYTVSFRRPGEKAYLATTKLPDPVRILKPKQKDVLARGQDIPVEVSAGSKDLDLAILYFEKNENGIAEHHTQKTTGEVTSYTIGKQHTGVNSKEGAVAQITISHIRKGTQPVELNGSTSGKTIDSAVFQLH